MNIFELALLLGLLATGYFAGRHLGQSFGLSGWILGFLGGALGAVAIFAGVSRVIDRAGKPTWKKNMNGEEAAQLIERFLENQCLYPQEWNDFVDTPQEDSAINDYRKQCDELGPLVNRPGVPDPDAVARLREMIERLRSGRV